MNYKIILVFLLGIIVTTIPVYDSFGYTFVGVTSNGVEFPISSLDVSNSTDTGDSILDGIGVYLSIQNRDTNGMVYFGNNDNDGSQTDIRGYVEINELDDWAIVVSDDDYTETLYVPEFRTEYTYVSGELIEPGSLSNVLGYSELRILSGDIIVTNNDEGIQFTSSGDGEVILKLNNYTDQRIFLKGNSTENNFIQIVTSDVDLMNDLYHSTYGYLRYSNTIDPQENEFSIIAGIDSIHTGLQTFSASGTKPYSKGHCTGSSPISTNYGSAWGTSNCTFAVNPVSPQGVTEVKIDNGDHHIITGDSTTHSLISGGGLSAKPNTSFNYELYDTLPSIQLTKFTEEYFEEIFDFPSEQTYLYVKIIDGDSTNIKGESYNPQSDVFFQVDGLPYNIAYDISKDGIVGIVGKTNDMGEISLLADDVDFGIDTSLGGMLNIYPNSLGYNGDYGIVMFDVLHGNTTILSVGEDLLYIPQNYIYWVFPISVEIDNVQVDDVQLNYLSGYYEENESLLIPLIPSGTTLYITINGEEITILMKDIEVGTQIKQVPKETSTSSVHTIEDVASVSSNISTSTFMIATHTGDMYVNFDFKVGGSVDFSMDSTYTGDFISSTSCKWHGASNPYRSYSCNSYSTPSNPSDITNIISLTSEHQTQLTNALHNGQASNLTVEVDIIRNMGNNDDSETILIYTSDSSQAYVTSTFNEAGYGANNQVYVSYPLDTVSENIFIPVIVGDMIEFVIRVNLEATGVPTPMSNGAVYSSYAVSTTELGGGIITVGMS